MQRRNAAITGTLVGAVEHDLQQLQARRPCRQQDISVLWHDETIARSKRPVAVTARLHPPGASQHELKREPVAGSQSQRLVAGCRLEHRDRAQAAGRLVDPGACLLYTSDAADDSIRV